MNKANEKSMLEELESDHREAVSDLKSMIGAIDGGGSLSHRQGELFKYVEKMLDCFIDLSDRHRTILKELE